MHRVLHISYAMTRRPMWLCWKWDSVRGTMYVHLCSTTVSVPKRFNLIKIHFLSRQRVYDSHTRLFTSIFIIPIPMCLTRTSSYRRHGASHEAWLSHHVNQRLQSVASVFDIPEKMLRVVL